MYISLRPLGGRELAPAYERKLNFFLQGNAPHKTRLKILQALQHLLKVLKSIYMIHYQRMHPPT